MDKQHILGEIKRLAEANGGKPPGKMLFERETGIKESDWCPHLWIHWGEALVEAGYSPNKLQAAIDNEVLIQRYIGLARELQKVPVNLELRRKAQTDKSFPSHNVFARFGGKERLLVAVVRYCHSHPGHEDIIALCTQRKCDSKSGTETGRGTKEKILTGFVYLMQSGRHYKIGKTNSVGRRERELTIQLPVPPKTIHRIETDDPKGVEDYWHNRFSDKRLGGEWFDLSPEDIRAFKRWKRIV